MIIELNFFFFKKCKVDETLLTKALKKFGFFIKLFSCLNSLTFRPINSAGSIPVSDKTEYLPPMKLLWLITSDFNFWANSYK